MLPPSFTVLRFLYLAVQRLSLRAIKRAAIDREDGDVLSVVLLAVAVCVRSRAYAPGDGSLVLDADRRFERRRASILWFGVPGGLSRSLSPRQHREGGSQSS